MLATFMAWSAPKALVAEPVTTHKPSAAHRLVHLFDFEEQEINHEPVPMHWVRAQDAPPARHREGFPKWNKAAFDLNFAHSGSASIKLPTRGGSTALRLVPGVIPVIPGGDYEISASITTKGLQHARARLVAQFTDAKSNPIASSLQATPLVRSDDGWSTVKVRLRGDYANAAWIQIDLELLQQDQFAPQTSDPTQADLVQPGTDPDTELQLDDLAGAAWFDDVAIRIVPIVTLDIVGDSNVVVGSTPPQLRASIEDVVGDQLIAVLDLTDQVGRTVYETLIEHVHSGVSNLVQPALPGYGWWTATFTVFSNGETIGSATHNLAWLPPPSNPHERDRFGLLIHEGAEAPRDALMKLLDAEGVGAVDLPYWRDGQNLAALQSELSSFTSLIEQLLNRKIVVTLALDSVPTDLANTLRISRRKVLEALIVEHDQWAPWLDEALTRFGQRVRRWRLGSFNDPTKKTSEISAQQFLAAAQNLEQNVFNPLPTLPLRGEIAPSQTLKSAALFVKAPPSLAPESITDLASTWDGYGEVSVLVEPISLEQFGADGAMTDLAIRTIRAWEAAPDRLMLEQPWIWRTSRDGSAQAEPTPAFVVWSQLGEHLRGRRIVGSLPVAKGAVALVLDGPAGGAIVAWNQWAQPDNAHLDTYLADGPVDKFDLFGNHTPIPLVNGTHHIPLSQTPIFIEGVDAELARFRAGFTIEPGRVDSTAELHELTMSLTNPWPVAINGDLQIVEPVNWSFSPQTTSFTIPAGDTIRIPLQTSFGLSELAGQHMLRANVRVVASEQYPIFSMNTPIQVGLRGVELMPSYEIRRRNGDSSVIVTVLVINTSNEPATLMAYATAPGRRRQQAPISMLAPGQSALRNFVFHDPDDQLRGTAARVGVRQITGLGQLTISLPIE